MKNITLKLLGISTLLILGSLTPFQKGEAQDVNAVSEINSLVEKYYGDGSYVKGTTINLTQTAVNELLTYNKGFHSGASTLVRTTYYEGNALWMSRGDGTYSYYGTDSSGNLTSGSATTALVTPEKVAIAVKKGADTSSQIWHDKTTDGMEGYYVTLKDVVAKDSHSWKVENGIYSSTSSEVIEWFKAITAPCYLGFDGETSNYIGLSKVEIAEVNETLELRLYADEEDATKLSNDDNLFSLAAIERGNAHTLHTYANELENGQYGECCFCGQEALKGFETSGTNFTITQNGAIVTEKAGSGWSSLKSTTSSKNWYLKAHLTDLVEESHAGGSWESIGLGMVDANGKHMQFTYWKPDSNADKTNRVGNFGLIDETGAIIKQCIPSTVYSCDDLNLAIHREDNLYHFYINDLMALTYDFSNSANYDSSGNDYPSLITRGVGCTYSNVELYYGDEIDAQLPKTINPDYAYSTSYKTEGLVDTSKYLSDGIVSFKASNQDTVSYRALATYNYVGDTFSIKAKFSGFDRTAGLVALGIKAGNAESVSINNAWGKANLFGLFLQNGTTVKIGARTDAYNDSRTYSVEWADALTGDFELEIRWIKGKYYCNFIGHNSDGTSVESGWIYWNLTTNGYYGPGVNGDRMSPVIGSFNNPGAGTVSNIVVTTGSAVVEPTTIVKSF